MNWSKWIRVFVLVTFLPIATGCGYTRPVATADDPGAEEPPIGEEPIRIKGYIDREGVEHEWYGRVHAVGADSLQFDPQRGLGGNAPPTGEQTVASLRLARADVAQLVRVTPLEEPSAHEPASGRKRMLAIVVAVGLVAAAVTIFVMSGGFDLDMDIGMKKMQFDN